MESIKIRNTNKILKIIISFIILSLVVQYSSINIFTVFANDIETTETTETTEQKNYYYLSDLNYITENNWSYAGYGNIQKDKNISGGTISLLIDGEGVSFSKGMGVHATGQLVYDISQYSDIYTRFVAKLGIDKSQAGKGSVWFAVFVSDDGIKWDSLYRSNPITSAMNAYELDLEVKGHKYLKIYIDSNGGNGNDHSVIADARVVKQDYDISSELYNEIQKVDYYDEILSKNTIDENYNEHFDLVLKRAFVSRAGYQTIQNTVKDNEEVKTALDWLLNDYDALQLLIETGNIGNQNSFLTTLSKLYTAYKDVIGNEGDAYIYKKMLIALSVSNSSDRSASPLRFSTSVGNPDVVERYRLVKYLYDQDLFARKEELKTYNMELMRMVVNDSIYNNEAIWLREYSEFRFPNNLNYRLNPYSYMSYVQPNYNQDKLYSQDNYAKYNEKYKLSEYGIPYGLNENGTKTSRTWMVMEAGGICWNISRLGQNLYKAHGIPVIGTYQPGHEAYVYYSQNNEGKGIWNIGNNISGWGRSYSTWGGGNPYRTLLNWGGKSFTNKTFNSTGYMLLAQGALNDYEAYQKSFYYNLIADSYNDLDIKEAGLNKSLQILNINLDTFEDLINVYKSAGDKTSEEWKELALKVIDAYTYYPMAVVDLLKLIEPYLDSVDTIKIDMLKTDALNKAKNATSNESLQPDACKAIVNALIGESVVNLASFSFDGNDAGKIVLNEKYDNYDFQVQYSLDGGNTWETSLEHKILLSSEQLASITAENDIKVKISGSEEVFTIDIKNGENISTTNLAVNDDENRLVGKNTNLEYSIDEGLTWKDYTGDVIIEGNQVIKARYRANGVYLSGAEEQFTFTRNTDPINNQYIPVKYLTFVSAGTSQGGQEAVNMIDASPFTSWHTKYGQVADDKSYIINFDKVRYLSQISYDPGGLNGRIKSAQVYTSIDGEEWTLAGEFNGWANNTNRKAFTLNESVAAKYVKILATETYGNAEGPNKYVSGIRFNYYEDTTKTYENIAH